MTCTTHHHACQCREEKIREALDYALSAIYDKGSLDDYDRLIELVDRIYHTAPSSGRKEGEGG